LDPQQIILFAVLIALSAFFSGTEIALMTLSKSAIEGYRKEKRLGSKSLDIVRKDTDKLLITILIGNNLVNTGAASLATASTLVLAQKMGIPGETGLAVITGVVTLIILMFGEITPKTLCARYAAPVALFVAPLYRILIVVFTPLSFLLNLFVKGVAKVFSAHGNAAQMSSKEFEAFIDISHKEGAVEADERRQIKNLLSLGETTADSVMTPRVNVEFVSLHDTVDEVCDFLMESSHSRVPVYGESTDDIDYIITFREAFKLQKE
jgi:putative hemolysin